jgi:hypothetical protein
MRSLTTTDAHRPNVAEDYAPFKRMLAACIIAAATILVLPPDLQGVAFSLFGVGTATALVLRVRRLPAKVRRPVGILAAAGVLSVGAGIVRGIHASVSGTDYPFPSPADVMYLADYILFIAAILYIVRRRVRRISADAILDSLVGLLAAGLLQWTLVLIPYVRTDDISALQKAANLTVCWRSDSSPRSRPTSPR